MAETSACRDLYFCPARKDFNFGNINQSHRARSGEYGGGGRQNSYFFFFQKRRNYCGGMSGDIVTRRICLKTVTGYRFL
jgi:hypothetical protein